MSDNGNFWSGALVASMIAGALYYCTEQNKGTAPNDLLSASNQAVVPPSYYVPTSTPAVATSAPAPKPNYSEKDGGTYYYVAAVSDEERKSGRVSGEVLSYRYGGKDENGAHIIFSGNVRYKCSVPCKIIKGSNGSRIAYNEESMIGAVFQDAMRGYLKADNPKPRPAAEDKQKEGPWTKYQNDPIVTSGSSAETVSTNPAEQQEPDISK